jgi:hypothetical protein
VCNSFPVFLSSFSSLSSPLLPLSLFIKAHCGGVWRRRDLYRMGALTVIKYRAAGEVGMRRKKGCINLYTERPVR